ncbi:hypothetical protein JAAARDRAFT_79538 [Jaapia argillacea MUCL 33604]|uniref:DNA polymerase lambda n=1 Tax=Jaapia argillacea MUCL 33604 TaxID=933084 RepID=A0A067PMM4_9AGAM|nr:hypothetical protein JAAARDRAFT_79538 [Jaapia argillacea MUCL 33604]
MSDLDDFFREQDEIMQTSGEDINNYLTRLATRRQRDAKYGGVTLTPDTKEHGSMHEENEQATRKECKVDSVPPRAPGISDRHEDVSTPAVKRLKRKLSESEQENHEAPIGTRKKVREAPTKIKSREPIRVRHTLPTVEDDGVDCPVTPEYAVPTRAPPNASASSSLIQTGAIELRPEHSTVHPPQDIFVETPEKSAWLNPRTNPAPRDLHLAPNINTRGHGEDTIQPLEEAPNSIHLDQPAISAISIPSIPASLVSHHSKVKRRDKVIITQPPKPVSRSVAADSSNVTTPANSFIQPAPPGPSKPEAKPPRTLKAVATVSAGVASTSNAGPSLVSVQRKPTKKGKEKELVTPLEYAQRLQLQFSLASSDKNTGYLRGKKIFYAGGDMKYASSATQGRMRYISKHGGTLVPEYDPTTVTHIVTEASERPTLRALGLKSLKEIPNHIATVKWSWVISGYAKSAGTLSKRQGKGKAESEPRANTKGGNVDDDGDESPMDLEFLHAAFSSRVSAGPDFLLHARKGDGNVRNTKKLSGGGKSAGEDGSGEVSRISEFTHDASSSDSDQDQEQRLRPLPSPPSSPQVNIDKRQADVQYTKGSEDPLAQFYAQAKAERDATWSRDDDASLNGEDEFDEGATPSTELTKKKALGKRGFACDTKGGQPKETCVNQDIIEKLEQLMELHRAKPSDHDRWRVFSYGKTIHALRTHPTRIKSFSEARSIRGVGEKTAMKIMEILETGELRRIDYENTDDVKATHIFQGIYGVGQHTAFMWYASGCRTLEDVKARKGGIKVSPTQEIGIKFYDDINSRMPRSEADEIYNMIKPIALQLDPKLFVEIMGSFRRGKADCGDIDILITRPTEDGKTHAGIIFRLLRELHRRKIITEDLSLPEDLDDLEAIYRGLCRKDATSKRRRIDFLTVPWKSRGAALLYYTGDDIFNRSIRLKANAMGYSLNQRGLFSGVVRNPSDRRQKVHSGSIIASETEEEIFRILGVPWQEPHERVRG